MGDNFTFSEEHGLLLESASDLARGRSSFDDVRRLIETDAGFEMPLWREIAELGWASIALPEDVGGAGLGVTALVCVAEPLGRHLMSGPWLATTLAGQLLNEVGTAEQRAAELPAIGRGEHIATLALGEPDASWESDAVSCQASRQGDGLVMQGRKRFVLDAAAANRVLVSCRLEGQLRLVCVDGNLLAKRMRRERVVDETRRSYSIDLSGLELPANALLGEGDSSEALTRVYRLGALLVAADMAGGTVGAFDLTLEYLKARKQFGKLIGGYQALKHPMVWRMVELEHARSLVFHAASRMDERAHDAAQAVRMAKAQAGQSYTELVDRAIQFHGAMGFTYECHAQLFFRRAQFGEYSFGDSRHHRRHLAESLFQ